MSYRAVAAAAAALILCGCQNRPASPPTAARPSISADLKRQDDQLVGQRFRTLLDFENDSDPVFASADGVANRVTNAHTGHGAYAVERGVTFKIDPLLYGTKLPGEWTLLGAYVKPDTDQNVAVDLLVNFHSVARFVRHVPAGTWAFVGIDLTDPATIDALKRALRIQLRYTVPFATVDDLLLINNTRTLVDDKGPQGWRITQRGGQLRVKSAMLDGTIPLASASEEGWAIDEISTRRLCLHRGQSFWTLLPDNRSILNGTTNPPPEPAVIDVAEECGRLNRDTPGDDNNDGFNERLGAFEVAATTGRFTMRVTPAKGPLVSPLIEITGLPPGDLTVMAEGKLIDTVARLPDGRVLLLLPITIDRPTEVTLRTSDKP